MPVSRLQIIASELWMRVVDTAARVHVLAISARK